MYQNLNIYISSVRTVKLHTWWVVTQKVPQIYNQVTAIMAIMMGGQPRAMQRNFDKKPCNICDARLADNPLHILFDCTALCNIRCEKIQRLHATMPIPMLTCFELMTRIEKLSFLLSPLQCGYVLEWRQVYEAIASMVFSLYTTRAKLYDALSN